MKPYTYRNLFLSIQYDYLQDIVVGLMKISALFRKSNELFLWDRLCRDLNSILIIFCANINGITLRDSLLRSFPVLQSETGLNGTNCCLYIV